MNNPAFGMPRIYRLCDLEHVLHDLPGARKFYDDHGTPQRKLKAQFKAQFKLMTKADEEKRPIHGSLPKALREQLKQAAMDLSLIHI